MSRKYDTWVTIKIWTRFNKCLQSKIKKSSKSLWGTSGYAHTQVDLAWLLVKKKLRNQTLFSCKIMCSKLKIVPKKTNACYHLHKHLTKYSNEDEFKTKFSSWNHYCLKLRCCETVLTLQHFTWKPIWCKNWHLTLWYCIT